MHSKFAWLIIFNIMQHKPVWWHGLPCTFAVFFAYYVLYTCCDFALANFNQRAHHNAHHVVQKAVACYFESDNVVCLLNIARVNCANVCFLFERFFRRQNLLLRQDLLDWPKMTKSHACQQSFVLLVA